MGFEADFMDTEMCGGKYTLGSDSIGMPVDLSGLLSEISVEGQTLYLKSSFHVTLVAIRKIIEKHAVADPQFAERVVADFCEFVRENEMNLLRFREEFKFASKGEKRSVVVMCDISNLNDFFDQMNAKYKLHVEYPPTHVTLYTLQPDKGIFLTDQSDIEVLTKRIENPGIKFEWKRFGL